MMTKRMRTIWHGIYVYGSMMLPLTMHSILYSLLVRDRWRFLRKNCNLLSDIKMYILQMHVSSFQKIKTKQPLCIIKLLLTIFLIIDPRLTNSLHGWKKIDFLSKTFQRDGIPSFTKSRLITKLYFFTYIPKRRLITMPKCYAGF